MTPRKQRQTEKTALELIEEAIHLLRAAPLATIATYYLGAVPFVLGLLYFWTDMSRSPFASGHLAEGALGVAALFVWMKLWQGVFVSILRARLLGDAVPSLTFARCRRILFSQLALQPFGLFLLPLALVTVFPFPWMYSFFQTVTARAESETTGIFDFFKKSWREAALWPQQNFTMLLVMVAFGLYVFLNWTSVCFLLPGLVKVLFGVESVFTRSSESMLNTTFFAAMFWLTYLCVDPIFKAAYTLRCFYGESRQSGEDLKAELRQFTASGKILTGAAAAIVAALVVGGANLKWDSRNHGGVRLSSVSTMNERERNRDTIPAPIYSHIAATEDGRTPPIEPFIDSTIQRFTPLAAATANDPAPAPTTTPPTVSPPELDRAIQDTIQHRKYTWRAPRKKEADGEDKASNNGFLTRFFERVQEMIGKWLHAIGDWIGRFLRRLFGGSQGPTTPKTSGYNWILLLQFLLWVLAAAVIAGIVIFIYRLIRDRRPREEPIASEAIQPTPDLSDENAGAEQLPEDGWATLARELLARGEFRLALRAFYLSSLANLAGRNLITLARFKSNREYERELGRRAHSFPELLSTFGQNVSVFDRIWYGLHEINGELVNEFASRVERIKGTP